MVLYSELGNYGVDPWNNIELNERPWYDPLLREIYMRESVYSQHVTMKVDLNEKRARTIYFNDLIPPRPNIAPLAPRAMDATRLYSDSFQREVTTARYGNGFAFHKESDMFNYWERNGGKATIAALIMGGVGQVVVDHLDSLARNEFLRHPYPAMGLNSASSFAGITNSDKMSTDFLDQVWLDLRDSERPFSALPQAYPTGSEVIVITTAGAVHDLKREVGTGAGGLNFVDVNKYTSEGRNLLIKGELGMYRGFRFVDNPFAKLWNVGTTIHQTTIKAAVEPGDGAPNPANTKVEGTRRVGQPSATHYILVNDASGFAPNDRVSIHKLRHDGSSLAADGYRGVLNGPIFDDPMKQDIEVHSIDTSGGIGAHKLILKEPYMMTGDNGKGLETDLGGTVYGYVTLGAPIHSTLFLPPETATSGLIAGVAQPPNFFMPPAIDDYMSVLRVSYDMWLKYQLWDARAFRVAFLRNANASLGKSLFR